MKEIKNKDLQEVAGGSLTSDILNFFRHGIFGSDSDTGAIEPGWSAGPTKPSQATGKGDEYGLALVTGLVTIAAAVATGIKFLSGK
ncbi:hypothetical protein AB1287_11910 [Enterobacter asburiae]|uniref:hypothetical protein n=1 Tax=unclassified Scandinavium TaxID=2830652 RepID=UPI00289E03E2|nr:hypothetical protein [Scandinavium sp.]